MLSMELTLELRSMKMCPAMRQAHPTKGTFPNSFFIIHLNLTPRNPYMRNASQ